MKSFPQWVCSDADKVPINASTGRHAKTNESSSWATFEPAARYAREHGLPGIGFVLTEEDPFVVIDLDNCIHEGELQVWASELLDEFSDTYIEVSRSECGLHIIGKGTRPTSQKILWTSEKQKIEVYDRGQYVSMTGRAISGNRLCDIQEPLDWLEP